MPRNVILDVDTGIDDALALLLAARSPELRVAAVTCVAGNVTLEHVVPNTLAVLGLAGLNVPVAVGARKPLMAELRTATFFHGSNGLGNVRLPRPMMQPVPEYAPELLVRMAREQPGEITLIAVGPLTNVALAVLRDPNFAGNLAELIVMGGAVGAVGNATPAAEANFSNDPEAARAVARAGFRLGAADLGATMQCILPMATIEAAQPRDEVGRFALAILDFYSRAYLASGGVGPALHDPLAVALAAEPDLAQQVSIYLDIETCGEARGASIATSADRVSVEQRMGTHRDVSGLAELPHNAWIPRNIDVPRFLDLFVHRLGLVP